MSDQQRMPPPIEGEVWEPLRWITTVGEVKWTKCSLKQGCEDCLHCILDDLNGYRPEGARAPGLARQAKYTRAQGGQKHHFCYAHQQIRKAREHHG